MEDNSPPPPPPPPLSPSQRERSDTEVKEEGKEENDEKEEYQEVEEKKNEELPDFINIQEEDMVITPPQSPPPPSPPPPQQEQQQHHHHEEDDTEKCWICFGDETDSNGLKWVRPCRCSLVGHEQCLLNWISEKRRVANEADSEVCCPQCNEPYHTTEERTLTLSVLEFGDSLVRLSLPMLSVAGLTVGGLLTSTTYGAHAVLMFFGVEDGERLLGSFNPWTWRIWLGLPSIPFILMLARTTLLDSMLPLLPFAILSGEETRLVEWPPSLKVTLTALPLLRFVYTTVMETITSSLSSYWIRSFRSKSVGVGDADLAAEEALDEGEVRELALLDRPQPARLIIGALLFPTISSVCGRLMASDLSPFGPWFRKKFPTIFLENLVGGSGFILLKDVVNLAFKYQKIKQRRSRRVQDRVAMT